jgi:hypothetical protein
VGGPAAQSASLNREVQSTASVLSDFVSMRDEMRDMREIEGGSKEVKLSHSPERNAGAGEEIFIFPITDEGVLRSYLTRPGAEEFLVAFAFSGALQDALAAEGILAIQNDTRDSEGEGPHFKGDFRVIVNIKEWRGIFFGGPPCFQHLRADEDCLEHKIADGRAFFAGLVVFYCICAGWALMRVVEQPDTICYDILDPAVDGSGVALFEVSSTQFGDSWHKFFRFALRNATLPPAEHPRRRNYGRASQFAYSTPDERDRARSSWAGLPETCKAVARCRPKSEVFPPQLDYLGFAERFAVEWHLKGFPVHRDYLRADAQPADLEERAYMQQRGGDHGRAIEGIIPYSLRVPRRSLTQLAPHEFEGLPLLPSARPSELPGAWFVCYLVMVAATSPPYVLIPAQDEFLLGAALPTRSASGDRNHAVQQAEQWLRGPLRQANRLHAFMVGETAERERVVAAPLPLEPDAEGIVRTVEERRSLSARRVRRLVWASLSALAGTWAFDVASVAVIKCQGYWQPGELSPESASPFALGARQVRLMHRPTAADDIATTDWQLSAALAHCETVHRDLRAALEVPLDDPDAAYLHSWIDRVGSCDLTEAIQDGTQSLERTAPEQSTLLREPFAPQVLPPETDAAPKQMQAEHCLGQSFTSPSELLTPVCLGDLGNRIPCPSLTHCCASSLQSTLTCVAPLLQYV